MLRRVALLGLVATALLSFACEPKKPVGGLPTTEPAKTTEPKAVDAAPVDADTLLLGEVGSLTGSEATFGISTKNGVQMALDEVNAKGGVMVDGKMKKVAVRVYDDQGKPEEAANAVTRLINQDHVAVILGEVASSNSLAMAPKAQAAQTPMVSPSSAPTTRPPTCLCSSRIFERRSVWKAPCAGS
jgi:branched-chain amino acid transport system substrate-binding protein